LTFLYKKIKKRKLKLTVKTRCFIRNIFLSFALPTRKQGNPYYSNIVL